MVKNIENRQFTSKQFSILPTEKLTASKKTLLYKCALVTKCQNSTVNVFRNKNRCPFNMQTRIDKKDVSLSTQISSIISKNSTFVAFLKKHPIRSP